MPETDDGYTVVQNVSNNRVVFSALGKDHLIVWHSPREHDGQDIQRVPKVVMDHTGFRRTIAKGYLLVTDEAALADAMQRQIEADSAKETVESQAATVLVQQPTSIVISEDAINSGVDGAARTTSSIESMLGVGQ